MTASATTTAYPVRGLLRRAAGAVALLEPLFLCALAPLLLFPRGELPLAALAGIGALWLVRWVAFGQPSVRTLLDLPVLVLLATSLVGLWASAELSVSLPAWYVLVLCLATYYCVANWARTPGRWWFGVAALIAIAVAVAALGLVSAGWGEKLPGSKDLYAEIPRLLQWPQHFTGETPGMNPNMLGGTLAFLLPLPFALLLWSVRKGEGRRVKSEREPVTTEDTESTDRDRKESSCPSFAILSILFPSLSLYTLLISLFVLLLTQSRGAIASFAVAALLLVALRWRRLGYGLAVLGTASLVALIALGPDAVLGQFLPAVPGDALEDAVLDRQRIWERAVSMIHDHPFTGVGLNGFQGALDGAYPLLVQGAGPKPHAHNLYLQAAVDWGLAGLLAFIVAWAAVLGLAVRAYRAAPDRLTRGAVAGLGAGVIAYLIFGIADAIHMGSRPAPLVWAMAGLIFAAPRPSLPPSPRLCVSPSSRHFSVVSVFSVVGILALSSPLWLSALEVNLGRLALRDGRGSVPSPRSSVLSPAASHAESALAWNPSNGRAHLLLGLAKLSHGDAVAALPALERAVELNPADPVIRYHLAEAYHRTGQTDSAVDAWRRAGAGGELLGRAADARKAADLESAETWSALAIQVAPENLTAWTELARVQSDRQRWAFAAATHSEVVRRFPAAQQGYEGLANLLYYRLQDRPTAIRLVDGGLLRTTGPRHGLHRLRSAFRADAADWPGAEADARRAIDLAPRDGWLLAWLGDLYLRQKRYDDALAQYAVAAELASDRSWLWRGLQKEGSVYAALQQWPAAVDRYTLALEESVRQGAKPDVLASNQAQLGAHLVRAGRTADAIAAYRAAVTLDPSHPDAPKRLADLLK